MSCMAMPAATQQEALDAASRLAAGGQHAAAEAAYDRILASDGKNPAALVGRGYTRAWQKNYTAAETDFRGALALDAGSLAARNGLGYNLAWAGRHAEAEFNRALA